MRNPPKEVLFTKFRYDPETGKLFWLPRTGKWSSRWNKRFAHTEAGAINPEGYRFIKLHGHSLGAHRVVWAMHHDVWPECLDHINGNPDDNRVENLRSVTRSINQRNQKLHSRNSSGVTGVYWATKRGDWLASIGMDGRQIHLGYFKTKDEAAAARREAEKANGFTGRL